jgi:hypothetical protein
VQLVGGVDEAGAKAEAALTPVEQLVQRVPPAQRVSAVGGGGVPGWAYTACARCKRYSRHLTMFR